MKRYLFHGLLGLGITLTIALFLMVIIDVHLPFWVVIIIAIIGGPAIVTGGGGLIVLEYKEQLGA